MTHSFNLSLALTSFITAAALAGPFSSPTPRPMGQVEKGDLVERVTVAGTIIPIRRTSFAPPYNGYLSKLFVHTGQHVNAGDPVVTFTQTLKGTSGEAFPLRAPFSGTVVQVLKQEGEYLETAKDTSLVARIDDLSRLFIQADVPESDIDKIKINQEVMIKVNAVLVHHYKGTIREIALAAKEKQNARPGERVDFDVRMEIMDKDEQIRPGMSAIVDIITAHADAALKLPQEFVQKVGDDYFVTLESGEKRKVKVGLQNEDAFQIVEGLKEGDKVRMVDYFSMPLPKS